MKLRPPRATRTDTLCPSTKLCRSPSRDRPGPAHSSVRAHADAGNDRPTRHRPRSSQPSARRAPANMQVLRVEAVRRKQHPHAPDDTLATPRVVTPRSEEHTSELQSLMRISYAVFCLKKKKITTN